MLTKEEKAMSRKRRCIRGHYFDGSTMGFALGAIGGSLLFRGFGIWILIPLIVYFFGIGRLEKHSYNQIKDTVHENTGVKNG